MQDQKSVFCDECDFQGKELRICLECNETLCEACDKKFHNRGNRMKHFRVATPYVLYEDSGVDLRIFYFAEQCYQNRCFESLEKDSEISLTKTVFEFILEETRKGIIFVSLEAILSLPCFPSKEKLLSFLALPSQENYFIKTTRRFGDFPEQIFFSLKLRQISIESLSWVLKSISIDKMKPTELLVQSRYKESFGLQIRNKWKGFIGSFSQSRSKQKKMNLFQDLFGKLSFTSEQESVLIINDKIEQIYEDATQFSEEDPLFLEFLGFIKDFFKLKENGEVINEERINKWLSSVETPSSKNLASLNEMALLKILQNQNIDRAIPGGKYGAALMLKNSGHVLLQQQSLGKLVALVSQALKSEILIHIKTFIVYNSKEKQAIDQDKQEILQRFQEQILELLYEQPDNTMTLAQLPTLILEKYGETPDLPSFGFPKLKNYLQTLEEHVVLQVINKNHIKVKLRNKFKYLLNVRFKKNIKKLNLLHKKNAQSATQETPQDLIKREGYKTLKQNQFDEKCKEIEILQIGSGNEHRKSCSTFLDYLSNLKSFIISTIKKNQYGISLEELERKVNGHLNTTFDSKFFKCENFEDFLMVNLEECIDIVIQKSSFANKEMKRRLIKVVYPKNLIKPTQRAETKETKSHFDFSQFYSQQSVSDVSRLQWDIQSMSDLSFKIDNQNFLNKHRVRYNKQKLIEEDKGLYQAFECQMISPINSFSNKKDKKELELSEEEEDLSGSKQQINQSVNFVQQLIEEDDISNKSVFSDQSNQEF